MAGGISNVLYVTTLMNYEVGVLYLRCLYSFRANCKGSFRGMLTASIWILPTVFLFGIRRYRLSIPLINNVCHYKC